MTADVTAWRNGVRMVGAVRWRLERLGPGKFMLWGCDFFERDEWTGKMVTMHENLHAETNSVPQSRAQHWADNHIRTWLKRRERVLKRRIARIEADITKAEAKRRRK